MELKCDRCNRRTDCVKMSIFTNQHVCEQCMQKERNHPMFEKARDAVIDAMNKGNNNFEGIGLPDDLT